VRVVGAPPRRLLRALLLFLPSSSYLTLLLDGARRPAPCADPPFDTCPFTKEGACRNSSWVKPGKPGGAKGDLE